MDQALRNGVDLGIVKIWGDFQRKGYLASVAIGQAFACLAEPQQQSVELVVTLKLPEVAGVGRRNIDRDVAGVCIHSLEAGHIVVKRLLNGCTGVFANIDPIAEHIRALDSYAPTSLSRMLELSDIEETETIPTALAMLSNLRNDNDRYIVHLRAGIVAAEAANEPAVGNFLQDILDKHQKDGWMLRSFTK